MLPSYGIVSSSHPRHGAVGVTVFVLALKADFIVVHSMSSWLTSSAFDLPCFSLPCPPPDFCRSDEVTWSKHAWLMVRKHAFWVGGKGDCSGEKRQTQQTLAGTADHQLHEQIVNPTMPSRRSGCNHLRNPLLDTPESAPHVAYPNMPSRSR